MEGGGGQRRRTCNSSEQSGQLQQLTAVLNQEVRRIQPFFIKNIFKSSGEDDLNILM